MKRVFARRTRRVLAAAVIGGLALFPVLARAHCDTLGGPVVKEGRAALESGDITPVLKWVKKDGETELRRAFALARSVRAKGPEARELADIHFLETLVRIHRAGEGAPYTGLKDEPVEPIIAMTDKALADGSGEALIKALSGHLAAAVGEKFERVRRAMARQSESVEAGREFVEAYVIYTHFVEALHAAIAGTAADVHGALAALGAPHKH